MDDVIVFNAVIRDGLGFFKWNIIENQAQLVRRDVVQFGDFGLDGRNGLRGFRVEENSLLLALNSDVGLEN